MLTLDASTNDPRQLADGLLSLVGDAMHVHRCSLMLRTPDGYSRLREHLELRVGYAGSVVNRHAVELFLIGLPPVVLPPAESTEYDLDEFPDQDQEPAGQSH